MKIFNCINLVCFLGFFSLAFQNPKPKVFVIGDSISIQYGPYLEQYLTGFWSYDRKRDEGESAENMDIPSGANGGDSGMVLAYLKEKFGEVGFDPDLMVINCGLHDIKTDIVTGEKQVGLARYQDNLKKIFEILEEKNIPLIWINTTPVDDQQHNARQKSFHRFAKDVETYNGAAQVFFMETGVPIIDLHQFTLNLGPGTFIDHVHYGEETRAKQAAYIAGFLNHYLK